MDSQSASSEESFDSQPPREVEYPLNVATVVPDTNDGLTKTVLVEGTGTRPVKGSTVTVHYVGTLEDGGAQFDSSRDRGEYFTFSLGKGEVIKGWDRGVATMRIGEKALLHCTPEYGYGAAGSPPTIPANATLLFEVELFDWTKEVDISENGDKSIMKNIFVDGVDYETPGFESTAVCDVAIYRFDGEVDDEALRAATPIWEKKDWSILVGDTPLPTVLETCLSRMRKKECASFKVRGRLLADANANAQEKETNEAYHLADVGKQELVVYKIEVSALTTVKTWEFKGLEKVEQGAQRKDAGNAAFKASNWALAEKKYRRALEFVEGDYGFKDDEKAEALKVRLAVWGNLAQVLLNQARFSDAITYCDKVVEVPAGDEMVCGHRNKALFRRARARDALGDWGDAKKDLEAVLKADANNDAARGFLQEVRQHQKSFDDKQKKLFQKMF